ncbi:MAG TPA: HNH endonuclease, partial [Kofleriaceae bacterium]
MPDEPQLTLRVLVEIEDRVFRILGLNVWQRAIYYHLLRHVVAEGSLTIQIGLASAARATAMSEDKIRRSIREMAAKGCVRIEDRGRTGHQVRLLLPDEIERVRTAATIAAPTIDEIDFYENRRYLPAILRRDEGACFYCARLVTAESVALDHVIAEADGGDNSHVNIVAACHECNSLKQATPPADFMRRLYR